MGKVKQIILIFVAPNKKPMKKLFLSLVLLALTLGSYAQQGVQSYVSASGYVIFNAPFYNTGNDGYAFDFENDYIEDRLVNWTTIDADGDSYNWNISPIGGGYGHNFVAKKWLFHISAQPCLIVYNDNSVRVNGEKEKTGTHFPEMIFNTRAAIIYNINRKYFAGSTFLFNTTVLGDKDEYTDLLKWRARAFVGIRL